MAGSDRVLTFLDDIDLVTVSLMLQGKSAEGKTALEALKTTFGLEPSSSISLMRELRHYEDLGDGHVHFYFGKEQIGNGGLLTLFFPHNREQRKGQVLVSAQKFVAKNKSKFETAMGASSPPATPAQKPRPSLEESITMPETQTSSDAPAGPFTPAKLLDLTPFDLRTDEPHAMKGGSRNSTTPGTAPSKRDGKIDFFLGDHGESPNTSKRPRSPIRSNFDRTNHKRPQRGNHSIVRMPIYRSNQYTQHRLTIPRAFGLANLGNTCYLNAVMQSLRAIKPFMAAVENTPQPEKSLFRIVADVWKRMAGKTEIVRPQELKSRMAQLNPMFAGNAEHDAHEFCLELLNQMHDELLAEQKKQTEQPEEKKPIELPTQIFDFTCSATLQCSTCSYQRANLEMYRDLSIDLPPVAGSEISLETLVENHFRTEDVEYRCEKCSGTLASSSRSMQVPPAVLALHVKRFSPNLSTNRIEKRSDRIVFPEVWSPKWPGTNQYRLHSFVNHVGASAATGHYVAFARGDEGWQEFDDSRVRAISSFSQLPPNAHTGGYLFFYVRE